MIPFGRGNCQVALLTSPGTEEKRGVLLSKIDKDGRALFVHRPTPSLNRSDVVHESGVGTDVSAVVDEG